MCRLTRKMMGQVLLPTIPMEIKSKEDLEEWHKVRKEYENMAIKLAEYEDREEKQQFQLGDTAYMLDEDYRFFESIVNRIDLNKGECFYTTNDADFELKDIGDWVFKSDEERAMHLENKFIK